MAYTAATTQQQHCWGFAPAASLQQLLREAAARPARSPSPDRSPDDQHHETYVQKLENSHAFASNACVEAMAAALGLTHLVTGLAGSLLADQPAASLQPRAAEAQHVGVAGGQQHKAAAEAAKEAVWRQVDCAWADEAIKRGVVHAKAGDYQQALGCYDKALELNPSSCDALVARGAAYANQGRFEAAVADFEAALRLQPSNANAAKYLQATQRHMETAGEGNKQQQQQLQDQSPSAGNKSSRHRHGTGGHDRPQHSTPWSRDTARPSHGYQHTQDRLPQQQRWQHHDQQLAAWQRSPSQQEDNHGLHPGRQRASSDDSPVRHPQGRSNSRSKSRGRSYSRSRSRERSGMLNRPGGGGSSSSGGSERRQQRHSAYSRGRLRQHSPSVSRSRSRSRSKGRSRRSKRRRHRSISSESRSRSSTESNTSSGNDGAARQLTLSDIQAAIRNVRSAKHSGKHHKRGSSKHKRKHERKHGRHKKKKRSHK